MKRIKAKNIEDKEIIVLIPENWKECNLEKFQRMHEMLNIDIESINNKALDNQLVLDLVELFAEDQIKNISLASKNEAKHALIKLVTSRLSSKMNEKFNIGMKTYLLEKDLNKMDWNTFITNEILLRDGMSKNMHKVLACLYREKNHFNFKKPLSKFDYDTLDKRAVKFQECLSIDDVYSAMIFFYHFVKTYSKCTLSSLKTNNQKNQTMKVE